MFSITHTDSNCKQSARAHLLTTCPRSGGSSAYRQASKVVFSEVGGTSTYENPSHQLKSVRDSLDDS